MKKLIELIKTKEVDDKIPASNKKSPIKEAKSLSAPDHGNDQQNDLYADGYSDLGYC